MKGGTAPVFIVLSIAVAGMMLGASGFSAAWGSAPPSTSAAQEQLNNSSGKVAPADGPVAGPVTSSDSAIIGLISSALGTVVNLAGAVALLPLTLIELGFPAFFAVPLGLIGQLVVGVSLIEFASNREWT
jgi:hypothetical protein